MEDATPERWLPVVGHEGLYEVSDGGRVRSMPRARTKGGLLKPMLDRYGYHWVTLPGEARRQCRRAIHQLVAEAFIEPRPDGTEVRHLDGNPGNNRPANLAYGSHGENMRDKREHGTDPNLAKTHCPQNHEYTEANTVIRNGSRFCRECARISSLNTYYAKREKEGKKPRLKFATEEERLVHQRERSRERQRRYQERKRARAVAEAGQLQLADMP